MRLVTIAAVAVLLATTLLCALWVAPRFLLGSASLNDLAAVIPKQAVRSALRSYIRDARLDSKAKRDCLWSLDMTYSNLEYFQPYIGEMIRSDYQLSGYACSLFIEKRLKPRAADLLFVERLACDTNVNLVFQLSARAVLAASESFLGEEETWNSSGTYQPVE